MHLIFNREVHITSLSYIIARITSLRKRLGLALIEPSSQHGINIR
jgi:hypothetical protein